MAERARAGAPDEDELAFEDRAVRLETTLGGAGIVRGDLTPGCAAALGSVLESLSAPAGRRIPAASGSGITMRRRRRCAG